MATYTSHLDEDSEYGRMLRLQLFAYGKKDWHTRHYFTPFYKSIQTEAIRL